MMNFICVTDDILRVIITNIPHFYLKLSMAKVRPKKNVVFGPAQLVVEDVPLPIAIPFGFFPFNSSYSSGFIMPTYGDEMNRGFYLRDGDIISPSVTVWI